MDDLIRHPLAYARLARGMSQSDLAREIRRAAVRRGLRSGTDRKRVSKWENGRPNPDEDSQLLLADVFDVDPATLRELGWPNWLPMRDSPLPLGPQPSTVPALREALASMDRRSFLSYSGTALASLAGQWASTEPDPSRLAGALDGQPVDEDLVDWLEGVSTRLSKVAGSDRRHTARLLDAHLITVTGLLNEGRYPPTLGLRLHRLAATLAQTGAWHRFDDDHHASAARYWHAALHSAHAADDRDLGAGILSDLAYQYTWHQQPRPAAEILQHALTRAHHPSARSLLHVRLARAHAALGERTASRRHLTAAERALNTITGQPVPTWCAWMSEAVMRSVNLFQRGSVSRFTYCLAA
ncbi:helix-turn-helix transcriptional regulator [Streptomyces sp. NBC_00658]|uniref:helix-turn-helix transcriptional regulator n=1 Tax=Streptomyces sp. NBC_00658 TaxID=2975800 RepID=UPI00324C42F8